MQDTAHKINSQCRCDTFINKVQPPNVQLFGHTATQGRDMMFEKEDVHLLKQKTIGLILV